MHLIQEIKTSVLTLFLFCFNFYDCGSEPKQYENIHDEDPTITAECFLHVTFAITL